MGFGHLPSGENTAWANRTLRAESLDQSWEANSAPKTRISRDLSMDMYFMGLFPLHPQNGSFHVYWTWTHIMCVFFSGKPANIPPNSWNMHSHVGPTYIYSIDQQPISPRLGLFEPVDETREPQGTPSDWTMDPLSLMCLLETKKYRGCSGTNPENMFCWVAITTPYDSSIAKFCKVMCWLDRMGFPGFPMDCDHPSFILDNKTWLVVEPYPSEKYDFVSWDDDIPYMMGTS